MQTALISPDMFVLHPALSDFGLPFFSFFSAFFFSFSVLFWQVFWKKKKKQTLVIPKLCQAAFLLPPFFFFFYYHGGFTNVHQRFGDERDEIILIPALPLSRSNSLTKLSDSILAPTARVNLLCHLQSTRGSAKSHSSLCQNPPTALLFRSIKVCPPPSPFTVCLSVCLYFLPFSLYLSPSPLCNLLYCLKNCVQPTWNKKTGS